MKLKSQVKFKANTIIDTLAKHISVEKKTCSLDFFLFDAKI